MAKDKEGRLIKIQWPIQINGTCKNLRRLSTEKLLQNIWSQTDRTKKTKNKRKKLKIIFEFNTLPLETKKHSDKDQQVYRGSEQYHQINALTQLTIIRYYTQQLQNTHSVQGHMESSPACILWLE